MGQNQSKIYHWFNLNPIQTGSDPFRTVWRRQRSFLRMFRVRIQTKLFLFSIPQLKLSSQLVLIVFQAVFTEIWNSQDRKCLIIEIMRIVVNERLKKKENEIRIFIFLPEWKTTEQPSTTEYSIRNWSTEQYMIVLWNIEIFWNIRTSAGQRHHHWQGLSENTIKRISCRQ